MSIKILINAVDPAECRVAKVKQNKLEDFHIESSSREITHGNIYKGIITRIEPALQAVFVDYLQLMYIPSVESALNPLCRRSLSTTAPKETVFCKNMKFTPIIFRTRPKKGTLLTSLSSVDRN